MILETAVRVTRAPDAGAASCRSGTVPRRAGVRVQIDGDFTLNLGPAVEVIFTIVPWAVGAYVLLRVVPAYQRRHPSVPADGPVVAYPPASTTWAAVGTDPGLIDRLGLGYEGLPGRIVATDVRTRVFEGYLALAAVVPERVWIDRPKKPFFRLMGVSVAGTHTLCALTLPGPLPTFNLLSEGRLGKLASGAGMRDLDTESAAFNDRRRVLAYDDRTGHALLAPNVVALMLDGPSDATLQIMGDQLVSFRRGELDPVEVEARLEWMVRIARAIPSFVYADSNAAIAP
ncbi:hypothetical protein [Cellulomonas sp. URHE0023]|uniref:hypothetical protein n=1 Tax=Cellulomonas sp. URHE0023 TaxID=1380354 RepID=UPI000485FB81|nr:hypothetical protein [Cellulomonas sp. URHE0023]